MTLLEKLKNSTPHFLKEFKVYAPDKNIIESINLSGEYTTKGVSCACGNNELVVFAYKEDTEEGTDYWAPAYLHCPKCGSRELVFDPRLHGYDAQEGDCYSIVEQGNLNAVNSKPEKIYVSYCYTNTEDFENEDISNLEDYFDMFALYIGGSNNLIFEYECA